MILKLFVVIFIFITILNKKVQGTFNFSLPSLPFFQQPTSARPIIIINPPRYGAGHQQPYPQQQYPTQYPQQQYPHHHQQQRPVGHYTVSTKP